MSIQIYSSLHLCSWCFETMLRTDQKFSSLIEFDSFCSKKFASMPVIAQFCYYGNTVSYYIFKHSTSRHQLVPFVFQLVCNTKVGFFPSEIILSDHLNISPDMTNCRKTLNRIQKTWVLSYLLVL